MRRQLEINIDGASRGNPGPGAIGVVIRESGKVIQELSRTIGEVTNNVAEYTALIFALQEALILKADELKIYTDSELLYHQILGQYKVKNPNLKTLFEQVQHLADGFKKIDISHIPREQNKDADKLANKALDTEQAKTVASVFRAGEESPSSKG